MALLILATLAILVKVPTIGTPAFWDETAFLGQAGWLEHYGLSGVFPGLRPDAQFFGHPPGLQLAAAVLFRTFGRSIEVAHALIAILGAIGVCATYAMVRTTRDPKTAVLAALMLLFSPAWFSSAGVFLTDLPVSALGALAAVLVMRGRLLAYCIVASVMVLIKETAVALVAGMVVYRALTNLPLTRATLRNVLPYAAPLLVFLAFIGLQKVATGRFFYIYDHEAPAMFDTGMASVVRQAVSISRWLFVAQFRWIVSGAIVLDLLVNREARRRPQLLLLGISTVLSGYAFSVILYMPRYVIPVLPFFYALGAVSLMSLARTEVRQRVAAAAMVVLTLWSLARDPFRGHGEDNLHYLGIVRIHQAMATDLIARYADAQIVSAWPTAVEFSDSLHGYVETPLPVKWFANEADLAGADVAVVATPANEDARAFERLVRRSGWIPVITHRYGHTAINAYQRGR